jgi:hypothetical protein
MKKTPLALFIALGLLHTPLSVFAANAPLDLVQPVSDYKIYVTDEIDTLAQETQKFTDAIKRATWPPPKSSTHRPACITSRSSRLPNCSVTSTRLSTPG